MSGCFTTFCVNIVYVFCLGIGIVETIYFYSGTVQFLYLSKFRVHVVGKSLGIPLTKQKNRGGFARGHPTIPPK